MKDKIYLGDGVYAAYDEQTQQVVLTTEDGYSATNTIYLEHFVVEAFMAWVVKPH